MGCCSVMVFVLFILINAITFGILHWLNYMAVFPETSHGLFNHSLIDLSAQYRILLSPSISFYAVCWLDTAFEAIWTLLSLVNLFRRVKGKPAFLNPGILGPDFFLVMILAHLLQVMQLVAFAFEELWKLVSLIAFSVMIYYMCVMALVVVYRSLDKFRGKMEEQGRRWEIKFIRIFVCNGVAMRATWMVIASVLNLGSFLVYSVGLSQEWTSAICIIFLTSAYIFFVFTDLRVFERFSRYTFSPYLVFLVAAMSMIINRWDQITTLPVFFVAAYGIVGFAAKVKTSFLSERRDSQEYKQLGLWYSEVYPSLTVPDVEKGGAKKAMPVSFVGLDLGLIKGGEV